MHQDETYPSDPRERVKNILSLAEEWLALIIISDYCFHCLEKKKREEFSLALLRMKYTDPEDPTMEYENLGVQVCQSCIADGVDKDQLAKNSHKALGMGIDMIAFKRRGRNERL